MYITIGVGVGGHCFEDDAFTNKPWKNGDPKQQYKFYRDQDTWKPTWRDESALLVDYVKVWAL